MKPYPKYKETYFEWISRIPQHWEAKRLKFLVKEKLSYGSNELAESEDTSLPRYIRITDFDENGELRNDTFKSLSFDLAKGYILSEGDILFARSGATVGKTFQFKNYHGLACYAGYLIKASPDIKIILSDFLYYFTKSNNYESWKNSTFIQATIQNISADKYSSLVIPLPNLDEQTLIIRFINENSFKIDSVISKKLKLIELLNEERTAIINRAVSKGIDPNVKMKYSGIEWLGEIPEHWEIKPIKYNTYIKGRIGWQGLKQSEFTESGAYLITGMNFKDGVINWDEVYHISDERYVEAPEIHLKVGDVLLTKDGTIGKLLFVDYLPDRTSLNSHLLLLRPLRNVYKSKFLYYLLHSNYFKTFIELTKVGTTFYGITQESMERFPMVIPQSTEQELIIEKIEEETSKINKTISKIKKEIELLQEYQTALISEAVTGKIDVRVEV